MPMPMTPHACTMNCTATVQPTAGWLTAGWRHSLAMSIWKKLARGEYSSAKGTPRECSTSATLFCKGQWVVGGGGQRWQG